MKKTLFGFAAVAALAVPVLALAPVASGLSVGDMTSAFEPHHVSGPDAGTDTCPVCKYGNRPAVQIWAQPGDAENTMKLAADLDAKVAASKHEFKAFVVNLSMCSKCIDATKTMASKTKLKNVGITYIDKGSDAVEAYKINTASDVKNTVFVYKNRKVVAKFVNLKADKEGLKALNAAIEKVDN